MPSVLFIVSVPRKVKGKAAAEPGKSVHTETSTTEVAPKVRDFIKKSPVCEWVSEEPFLNGKVWWSSFMFTCSESSSEATVSALCELGVGKTVAAAAGKEPNGKGMILVLPVNILRIGSRPKVCGYTSSLFPANLSPSPSADADDVAQPSMTFMTDISLSEEAEDDEDETDEVLKIALTEETSSRSTFKVNFTETIKSRVTLDSVISYCMAASEFSFDYVNLIINASIIACVGLVTNNTVIIVASMLVSPLMGPIMALTFGSVVDYRPLIKQGISAELWGLFLCILIGFIGGLCAAPFCGQSWPTQEMASRGVPSALWTGVAIAIPSGFGAALSITGNNTSSLVGVAISASLLPPAVNCGVLLAMLALQNTSYISTGNQVIVNGELKNFEDTAPAISLGVTLVNVVLINICAYIMFRVKGLGASNSFWNKHVKNARKFHRAARDPANKEEFEKAFEAAKHEKHTSLHGNPMEKIHASINMSPFTKKTSHDESEPKLESV